MEDVIETLDDYFLSKEEWDTIVELGLGPNNGEVTLKKISSATKSTLTRKCVIFSIIICFNILFSCPPLFVRYNATDHPVAFHKAQDFGKAPKKIANDAAPDLEDVFDVSHKASFSP